MYNKIILKIMFYKLDSNIYFKISIHFDNMVNFIFIYNSTYKSLTNMYICTISQKRTCICIKSNNSFILSIYLSLNISSYNE